MAIRSAFLAGAMIASASPAANAGQERPSAPEPAVHRALPCETGEARVFAGAAMDDPLLNIAVCMREETLTIRYVQRGYPQAVSCRIGSCAGIIDFHHYVRYRLTIVTLVWRDEHAEHTLTESLDAQNEGGEPAHIVTHAWVSAQAGLADAEPLHCRMVAYTEPLSLVALHYRHWP